MGSSLIWTAQAVGYMVIGGGLIEAKVSLASEYSLTPFYEKYSN